MTTINQHYVPQFYLKNFENQIHCFDKTDSKKFVSNPKRIAVEGNFYGPTINGEHPLEKEVSRLESKFNIAISELQQAQNVIDMSWTNFKELCGFLGLQYVRTKETQFKIKEAGDNMFRYLLQQKFPDWSKETIQGIGLTEMGVLLIQLNLIKNFHEFANIFLFMKFVTMINKTNEPFWTSDNPIAIQNKTNNSLFSTLGLFCKGIQVHFPINPKLSILVCDPITFENLPNVLEINDVRKVKEVNFLQLKSSYRFVFSNTDEFLGVNEMLTKNPELKNPNHTRSELLEVSGKDLQKHKLEIWADEKLIKHFERDKKTTKNPDFDSGKFIMTRSLKCEKEE